MRPVAALFGYLASLGGLLVVLISGAAPGLRATDAWLAIAACAVGLLGALLIGRGLPRWGALPLLGALIGLWIAVGEAALIPAALLLLAAILALLAPGRARRWHERR